MTKKLTNDAKQAIDQHLKRDLAKIDAGQRFYVSDLDTNADLVTADYVDDYLINDPVAKNFIHSDNLRFSRQIDDIKTDVVTNDVSSYIYQKLLENPQICWNIREKDQDFGFECAHDTTALSLLSKEQMEDYKVVFDLLKALQKATKNKNFSFDLAKFEDYPSKNMLVIAVKYKFSEDSIDEILRLWIDPDDKYGEPFSDFELEYKESSIQYLDSNEIEMLTSYSKILKTLAKWCTDHGIN